MAYYIVLGLGVVVSFIFCVFRRTGFSLRNLIYKSVSSLCYMLTAVFALVSHPEALVYGELIVFGGALGLVGDILLDLKGLYKKDESVYLRGGFIFFLIGHVFYSSAIIYQTKMAWWLVLIAIGGAILFAIGNNISAKFMKVHFGAYRRIVFVYVVFLAITLILSIIAAITSHFEKKYVLLAIGAISFTLSDAVLSSTFFGRNKDGSFYLFINHFLYYAGQYLIAASVMFM